MKVSPSMLACDFSKMGEEIQKISSADMVHMDIMDGNFVPNISFGADVVKSLRPKTALPFDVHLMVQDPIRYVEKFVDAGADIITFHIESDSSIEQTMNIIKSHDKKVGLSLKPNTKVETLFPYLKYIDVVLIMTVEPGFGGQKFMAEQMQKATAVKEACENKNILIEVDGGVNLETIETVKKYPVDICVSGTCIFKSENISDTIDRLR